MNEDYPALDLITKILKGIGILIILLAVAGIIIGIKDRNEEYGLYLVLGSIFFGIIGSIQFFASAELIQLLIRIEINTRNLYHSPSNEHYSVVSNDRPDSNYSEWAKQNPNKGINDYYVYLHSKSKNDHKI